MDEVINIKDIYDRYEKDFAKPKQTLTYLDSILTSRFDFFTKCQTIVNTCLYLKDTNPEAIKPNLQYMQQLQERFEAEMNEKYDLYEFSYGFNPFDDLNKLATLFNNTREADEARLQAVHKALAAIDRLPDLLATVFIIYNNGFNIDQLVAAIASADAELEAGYRSMYFQKPGEKARYYLEDINPQVTTRHRKLCIMIHYYPRLVEKLETFLHLHARSFKCTESDETNETIDQKNDKFNNRINHGGENNLTKKDIREIAKEGSKEGTQEAIKEERKKQRARTRNSGGGRKPTYDVNNLQCQAYWVLREQFPAMRPSDCANQILSDPKWRKSEFKKDNPYPYTSDMTKERKSDLRKIFIRRANRYRVKMRSRRSI